MRDLFDPSARLSAFDAVVTEKRDAVTIAPSIAGTGKSPRVVYDLGLPVNALRSGDALTLSGTFETSLSAASVTSFSFQVGAGTDTGFTNVLSYDVTPGKNFRRVFTVTEDFLTAHAGKTVRVRMYACYNGTVALTDQSVWRDFQVVLGGGIAYRPHVVACDTVARVNSVMHRGAIADASGIDLDDFITPGMWVFTDTSVAPAHWPSDTLAGRFLVFATTSPSSFSTFHLVIDSAGKMYHRYSPTLGVWTGWRTVEMDLRESTLYNYGNVTTAGLDLSGGDFIHPGIWAVVNTAYLPKNCPTTLPCRIVSFASITDNTIFTWQVVWDQSGQKFERFSVNTSVWSPWVHHRPLHGDLAFEPVFVQAEPFVGAEAIDYDTQTTGRVARLLAQYDAVTPASGVRVSKESLGKDASNTYPVWNYKVSRGTGDKPVVLVIVGEHGNEPNSAVLGWGLYRQILDGVLTKYLRFVDFWVIPIMNPWGYENRDRNNSNGVNLNRDFPAAWSYSEVAHNVTGNYSLSQPETRYIYNLLVSNRDKILFVCNKHDTGSISRKIIREEADLVAYVSTMLETDAVVNQGVCQWQNTQVRETDPWIVEECSADISGRQLIVSQNLKTPGSLDVFANSIGIHGSLLEVSYGNYEGEEVNYYPEGNRRRAEMARLGLDFFVNYIAQSIQHNRTILSKDDPVETIRWFTRRLDESTQEWVLTEQYWDGETLRDV